MTVRKVLSIAIVNALLAACSSSSGGGGGNGIRPNSPLPPSSPSLSSVPQQYRSDVSTEKTISLVERITQDSGFDTYRYNIDGKTEEYNFSDLPNGRTNLPVHLSYESEDGVTGTASATMLVYQQPYSVVTGITYTQFSGEAFEGYGYETGIFFTERVQGLSTPNTALMALVAQDAVFEYKGVAFDGKEEGTLNYTMFFGERKGHGSITGFSHTGAITLWPAQLAYDGFIRGDALLDKDANNSNVKYALSFFGPNAEEIAGHVYDNTDNNLLGSNQIILAGNVARKTIP